jgi:hypothetical protein
MASKLPKPLPPVYTVLCKNQPINGFAANLFPNFHYEKQGERLAARLWLIAKSIE